MANNFADDARIIDFWRFENNLTAGKNGNDLTASAGGVAYESGAPLEGSYSLSLTRASAQYASRADADLSANFPLKDGDTDKKGMWFCRFKPTAVTSQYQLLLSKASSTSRGLQVHLGYDNLVIWWGYSGVSYHTWSIVDDIFSAGGEYSIGIIFDGVNKTCTVRLYDHDTDTATTYEKTFVNEMQITTNPFYVGIAGGSTNYFGGLVDEVVAAIGDWTVGEIDQIRQGTFGASTSLTVNSGSHSHALTAPVLTQKHNIAVAAASHAQAITSPVLVRIITLSVADMGHGQTVEAPVLTQLHTLEAQNASHAQVLGSPALTQNHILVNQNCAHGQSLDALALTQLHTLVAQVLAHAQALEAPALSQKHTLTAQDAAHGHSLEAPALTQAHSLTVQAGAHDHDLDASVLTQLHILAVAALIHAQSITVPILAIVGEILHSKGSYAALPADNADLITGYSEQEVLDIAADDETRVSQISYGELALHQFKKAVAGNKATIAANVRSNISGVDSIIYLQIYNHDLHTWETIDSDDAVDPNTDFNLAAVVADLTNYKDLENQVSCRVYQEAA